MTLAKIGLDCVLRIISPEDLTFKITFATDFSTFPLHLKTKLSHHCGQICWSSLDISHYFSDDKLNSSSHLFFNQFGTLCWYVLILGNLLILYFCPYNVNEVCLWMIFISLNSCINTELEAFPNNFPPFHRAYIHIRILLWCFWSNP